MPTDVHGQMVLTGDDGKGFAELKFKRAYRRYGPDWWKRITSALVNINIDYSDMLLADISESLRMFHSITVSEGELKHVLWQLGYEVGLVTCGGFGYSGHWIARAPRPAKATVQIPHSATRSSVVQLTPGRQSAQPPHQPADSPGTGGESSGTTPEP